jgi:hypothetical protein
VGDIPCLGGYIQNLADKLKRNDNLGDLGLDGRITFKMLILKNMGYESMK